MKTAKIHRFKSKTSNLNYKKTSKLNDLSRNH
ncbi:hypothetical protein T06_9141 [Trichinella sp. T6]|nr:hypothetical protein T06_9141 [Trichinella sp. T6]